MAISTQTFNLALGNHCIVIEPDSTHAEIFDCVLVNGEVSCGGDAADGFVVTVCAARRLYKELVSLGYELIDLD